MLTVGAIAMLSLSHRPLIAGACPIAFAARDPGKAASADADCAFCHAASPWAAPGAARLDAAASAFPMDSVEQPLAQGRRPDPPDRPQWAARAFA